MNGRRGDLGSTSMAFTRESFCRYASSTCQRTSSDREPTLRSSKFWGGLLLASRLCKASYRFVCCGRERAWCSLGLPIGAEGSPLRGSHYYWAALLKKVAGSSSTPQGDRWARRSPRPLPERADSAGSSFMDGRGFVDASVTDASLDSSTGSMDAFWGDCHVRFRVRVRVKFTSIKTGARARMRQGQYS